MISFISIFLYIDKKFTFVNIVYLYTHNDKER